MSKLLTQRGQARIAEFVASWTGDIGACPDLTKSRSVIERALTDFLFAENACATPGSKIAEAALSVLTDGDIGWADTITDSIVDLRDRLDEEVELNLILREHHVLLAEENRRLREAVGQVHPEPC